MGLSVDKVTFLDKGPFTFSVDMGECVGLTGRSGIGKTQLFRAITDLLPAGGEILLDGTPSTAFTPAAWRTKVTMVPAEPCWWYDRVGDHFSKTDRSPTLSESCTLLGLDPHILDWQVSRLSTGEKQRLALLRALQNRPVVLLLDEPSSGLDTYHTGLLETFIDHYRLLIRPAVLWVSHDAEQLQRVTTRRFVMEQHKLYETT